MTDYGLNLSVWGRDLDLYSAIPRLAEAGFRRCELWEEAVDLSAVAVERWRRLFDSHGVRAFAMHAPSKQDLALLNETVRRLAVHTTIRSFAGFSDVGGYTVVVHPNSDDGPHSMGHYPLYEASLLRSLDDINVVAERLGLTIAVENMLHKGTARPFWQADDLLEVVCPGSRSESESASTPDTHGPRVWTRRRRFAWPGRVCARCTCTTTTG